MLFLQSTTTYTSQSTILSILRNTALPTSLSTLYPHRNITASSCNFSELPRLFSLVYLSTKFSRLQLLHYCGSQPMAGQPLYASTLTSTHGAIFANLGLSTTRPVITPSVPQYPNSSYRGTASTLSVNSAFKGRLWVNHYDDSAVCDVLTRFLESVFRNRVALRLARSYSVALTSAETYRLLLFRARMSQWLGMGGASPTWQYAATALYIFFKLSDAQVLTAWLHSKLRHMSLFGHGRFLSMFFFTMGIFFLLEGHHYGIVGIRCRVAGKISVAGNARKRKLLFNRGRTSSASVNTKVSSSFYLVRTSTGCLGLTIWLFYE